MKTNVLTLLFLCSPLMAQGWTDLGSSTIFHNVCPANNGTGAGNDYANYGFRNACPNVFNAWGSAIADTKRNRLVIWGGGHGDYSGNEMYSLNMSGSPAMVRLNNPSAWDYSVSYDTNADGTPTSRHTWGSLVYDPLNDAMLSLGGATPNGRVSQRIWKATFDASGVPSWTQMSNIPISPTGFGNFAVWDPNTQSSLIISNNSLLRYVTATDTLTTLNAGGAMAPTGGMLVVDPVRKMMFDIGQDWSTGSGVFKFYAMDIGPASSYNFVDWTSQVTGCSLLNAGTPALVYDTQISRIVGYPGSGQTVTIFDPGSKTCVNQTLSSPTVPSSSTANGIYNRFNFLPSLGKYVLCNNTDADCFSFTLSPNGANGLGNSTLTCIDVDGDGYGTGPGCLGPDADDNDASVHTAAQAISKYGTLAAFINHLGYNPSRLWYVSTMGNDGTCAVGTLASPPSTPCLTWLHVYQNGLTAGDMVMFRGGSYTGGTNVVGIPTSGTSGHPIIVMAYPGELPFIDQRVISGGTANAVMSVSSWSVFDGLKGAGGLGSGCITGTLSNNVIIRHTDTTECALGGIAAFDGLVDWTIEYNVAHDMNDAACGNCQHALYLGSRNNPSSNIAVRRNLWFNPAVGGWPAYQFNGRMLNTVVEQNIIYGTEGSAMSLLNGVSYSRIISNVMFNNNGGLNISNYDGSCYPGDNDYPSGICPYDQTGNLIANNTIYIGGDIVTGVAATGAAISVSNVSTGCPIPTGGCKPTKQGNLGGNVYENNIFFTNANGYTPLLFSLCTLGTGAVWGNTCTLDAGDTTLSTSIFNKNIIFEGAYNSANVLTTAPGGGNGSTPHTLAALNAGLWSASSTGNLNADPTLAAASPSYWNSPASFNLRLQSTSPLIGAGLAPTAPSTDIWGAPRRNPPSIGAIETSAGNSVSSPCDINGDGVVNGTDIQAVVSQVLGITSCTTGDLLRTGQCNVVDVQRVINAITTGICVTGQ